ncbi:MAG: hypothetical protein R3E97_05085 [Candidatus Eisenbacteria bacterium]
MNAIAEVKKEGGEILCGGNRLDRPGNFTEPTIATGRPDAGDRRKRRSGAALRVHGRLARGGHEPYGR